jgi:hypothetical protein
MVAETTRLGAVDFALSLLRLDLDEVKSRRLRTLERNFVMFDFLLSIFVFIFGTLAFPVVQLIASLFPDLYGFFYGFF